MALDPKMLESLPDTLVDLYGLVEIDILEDMARRISTYDYFIPAALHQNQKLQELGMVQEEIIKRLSALTGQTQAEIVQLLSDASAEAVEDDIDYYTRAEVYEPSKVDTEALYAQLNSGLLQTEQAFFNITRTTANTATKQFERALDRAWLQISTGAFDYNTAIKRAILDLAEQGLGAIEYKSGRVDSIEVAVRRAVVTGANQTTGKIQEKLADDLGVDLVEVTAHGGARPEHAKWQGKCYSRNGRKVIDGVVYEDFRKATRYGYGDGLKGWNCHHDFHPYVHGSSRTWTDKEIKALEAKKITYNGKKLTEYEASQEQRKIEREIRKQKKVVAALEAVGEDASAERKKLRDAQKSYTDFTEQTGMKKQSARTQIASKKAEREVNKANKTAGVKTSTTKGIEQQREQIPTPPVNSEPKREYKELSLDEFKTMKHSVTKEERSTIYGRSHFSGYVNSSKAKEINAVLRSGGKLPDDFQKVADALQSVIDKNTISDNIIVHRYVRLDALESITGVSAPEISMKKTATEFFKELDEIPGKIERNHIYTEKGFLSTSGVEEKNVMSEKEVYMRISVLSGTHGYVTTNNKESEIIFGQNTKLRITNSSIQGSGAAGWKIVLDCVIDSEG